MSDNTKQEASPARYKLTVDVIDCETKKPISGGRVMANRAATRRHIVFKPNEPVCVSPRTRQRDMVKFAQVSDSIFEAKLEPGMWSISVGDRGGMAAVSISMPEHDAHLKDLITEPTGP